jgi:hypothetical protein
MHIGGSTRGYQELSAPLAIPTTAEQAGAQAACLCIASVRHGRPLLPPTGRCLVSRAGALVRSSAWLLVLGYAANGLKDFWQERSHYVAGTRWWPPFCAAVDWLVAVVLVIEIIAGAGFHH